MRRKVLSLLLVMAMGMTLLAGCGGSDNTNASSAEETNVNEETVENEIEDEVTEEKTANKDEEPTPEIIDLGGRVIVDNELVKIYADKLEHYPEQDRAKYCACLYVAIENKSEHDDIRVEDSVINGKNYVIDWILDMERKSPRSNKLDLPVGETTYAALALDDFEIRQENAKITDIFIKFSIGTPPEIVKIDAEHIYPYGEALVENNEEVNSANSIAVSDLGDDLSSLTFSLEGVCYQFPMAVNVFLANGWEIPSVFKTEDMIEPGAYDDIVFENSMGQVIYEVRIKNTTDEPQKQEDCLVNRMLVVADQGFDFALPEGISFASTEDELKAVTPTGSIIQEGNYTKCVWDNEAWTDSITAWYHPEIGVEYFEFMGWY